MTRKNFYLLLALVGTILPLYSFYSYIQENGWLLEEFVREYTFSHLTVMFTWHILFASIAFWVFMFHEAKKRKLKNLWLYILLNLLIGLSCSLPLFLAIREGSKRRKKK